MSLPRTLIFAPRRMPRRANAWPFGTIIAFDDIPTGMALRQNQWFYLGWMGPSRDGNHGGHTAISLSNGQTLVENIVVERWAPVDE